MDEYIRKQDAIDAIHCDIKITGRENAETVCKTIESFTDGIKSIEPADVVQVVRCENCVHWSDSNQCARPELSGSRWHDAKYFETMPDDFCSYGERREE